METALHIDFVDYSILLKKHELAYAEEELWLRVGSTPIDKKWLIYISVIRLQMFDLLEAVLPVLSSWKVSFKIIKNRMLHQHLNLGQYGSSKIGKVITLYPVSEKQALDLVSTLIPLVNRFSGPRVKNSVHLGNILYTSYSEIVIGRKGKKGKKLSIPRRSMIPFEIKRKFKVSRKRKIIINARYILVKTIRKSSKGYIYKALSINGLPFQWCVIKEGRLNMVDDLAGRTIRDRLLWQKEVIEALYGKIPVPRIIGFVEEEDSYLVMEYIKGRSLSSYISAVYNQYTWKDIARPLKKELLSYYLLLLQLIDEMHQHGYVHRNVKDGNLMILPNGTPLILDFELSYSISSSAPYPPFRAISPGYQPPEQLGNDLPTIKEDIYSLGALLIFLLSGVHPEKVIRPYPDKTKEILQDWKIDEDLSNIILSCLQIDPRQRPEITEIETVIAGIVNSL